MRPPLYKFDAEILISVDHGKGDADNRIKCVLDWAQRSELVINDSHAQSILIRWVKRDQAPEGCLLTLTGKQDDDDQD